MTSKYLCILAALMLAGCGPKVADESRPSAWYYDQDIRERVFLACLEKAPAGPEVAKYNDWDEVVNECSRAAGTIAAIGTDSLYTYRRQQKVEM